MKPSRFILGTAAVLLLALTARGEPKGAKALGAGELVRPQAIGSATSLGSTNGTANFRRMKYGFFAHYTWGGMATDGTHNRDGSFPAGLDEVADRFDVAGFANDLASMGVEYVIFTAWHSDMNCLWPSAKMDQWLTGHTAHRDLLGEMLTAVRAKGIRVLFYTHPRDGHDMNQVDQIATGWNGTIGTQPDYSVFDRLKWNNFINDVYSDLIDRYGAQIDGLFVDEGSVDGDSWRVVDYPRLRQTIKSRQPDLIMIQNFYGSTYSCDIGATEVDYWGAWLPATDPDYWPATGRPMSMVMGAAWAATLPEGTVATQYDLEEMFRMTVLRAGVNSPDGGGVNWAAGPYPGGGWETGVLSEMQQLGAWIAPIRRSICNTYPSQSWVTPPDSTINSLAAGMVATRSADDGTEFIHVLTPPAGSSLTLPAPADGRGYARAMLLPSGNPVDLARQSNGSLTLTLTGSDTWDSQDTVIQLTPVTVTWVGNDESNGTDTGEWSAGRNNFTGGFPIESQYEEGDNVNFAGAGASQVMFGPAAHSVGDLHFSGKSYDIYPNGSGELALTAGRIDVASGVTVGIHGSRSASILKLAGAAGLTKTGDGTLDLALEVTYTGDTVLSGGALQIELAPVGGGNIVFDGGVFRDLSGTDVSSRIQHSAAPITVDTRVATTYATPLSATNTGGLIKLGPGTLSLTGGVHLPGNPIIVADGRLRLAPGTSVNANINDSGFESPAYDPGDWSYEPANTEWFFGPGAGIASNGSPWVGVAPEGLQCAFLQNDAFISTTFSVQLRGNYLLSFRASNRPHYPPTGLHVSIDGLQTMSLTPGAIGSGGDFTRFQSYAVSLDPGPHQLKFSATQNGDDSDTLIDDVSLVGVRPGSLAKNTRLELTSATASYEPGTGASWVGALAAVSDAQVVLNGSTLTVTGNDPDAAFAGIVSGTGNLINQGTLRLVVDAALNFTGTFTNYGVLDLINWNGTLPPSFVNYGTVLDSTAVRVTSTAKSQNGFALSVRGFSGHTYQLQRSDALAAGWQDVGASVRGDGGSILFTDPNAAIARLYYRVAVSP